MTPGTELLARTAGATRPSRNTTCSPVAMSVATAANGMWRSAKVRSPISLISLLSSGARLTRPSRGQVGRTLWRHLVCRVISTSRCPRIPAA
jgi:hypothetical protein